MTNRSQCNLRTMSELLEMTFNVGKMLDQVPELSITYESFACTWTFPCRCHQDVVIKQMYTQYIWLYAGWSGGKQIYWVLNINPSWCCAMTTEIHSKQCDSSKTIYCSTNNHKKESLGYALWIRAQLFLMIWSSLTVWWYRHSWGTWPPA